MKFGLTPLDEAEGAILAHGVRIDGIAYKKGDECFIQPFTPAK